MSGWLRRGGLRLALAASAVVVVGAGTAYATTAITADSAGDAIVGCARKENGQLRVVADASQCLPSERPIALQGGAGPKSVTIDCAAGEKVGDALDRYADSPGRLTVTIDGVCVETVVVRRDDVVLQNGALRAPSTGAPVLQLSGASRVALNNLVLVGGSTGIDAWGGGSFTTSNVRVTGASFAGVRLDAGAEGQLHGTSISASGDGLYADRSSSVTISASTIADSAGFGVNARASSVTMFDTTITGSGRDGVTSSGGAFVMLIQSTIADNDGIGVFAWAGGSAAVGYGTVVRDNARAGITADSGGSVDMQGVLVARNAHGVTAYAGGHLVIQQGTIVEDSVWDGVQLTGGSSAKVRSAVIRGNGGTGLHVRDTSTVIVEGGNQIVDNGGWGVYCEPAPDVAMLIGHDIGTVTGNGAGEVGCPYAS